MQLEGAGEGGKGMEPGVRRDFGDAPIRGHQQLLRVKDAKAGQVGDKAAAVLLGERVAEIGWGEIKLPGNVAQRNRLAEVGGDIVGCAAKQFVLLRLLRRSVPVAAQKLREEQCRQGRDADCAVREGRGDFLLQFGKDGLHGSESVPVQMPDPRRWEGADQPLQRLRQTRQVEQNLFQPDLRRDQTVKMRVLRGKQIEIPG